MKNRTAGVQAAPSVSNRHGESLQLLDGLRNIAALYVVSAVANSHTYSIK